MYLGIAPQKSCARAWVAAASALIDQHDEGYNVVIDVENPWSHDDLDNTIIGRVDAFLREHDQNPILTVANTIFPQALYDAHRTPAFYDVYHRGFDRLSRETRRWGQYFERMTRHRRSVGGVYNPLADLIEKMKHQKDVEVEYRAIYELAVYDPLRDGRFRRGGPCLSFLSFKVHPNQGVLLTAIYRNHTYVTKCLGNLIGLGRLQAFVAREAGLHLGSLTCVSTHAKLDTGEGWGIKDARKLVKDSAEVAREGARATAVVAQ